MKLTDYIVLVLEAFQRMRHDAVPVERAYLNRLRGFGFGADASKPAEMPPLYARSRLRRHSSALLRFVRLLPAMIRQSFALRGAEVSDPVVVTIASNRLPISQTTPSVKNYFAELGRALGSHQTQPVSTKILNARHLLLFD